MFSMEKYAVIKLGSKQYLIHEGDVIELERQEKPLKIGVLMYSDGSKAIIGDPEVKEVLVKASVLEEKLGKKVRVARFKKKSRYEKVRGHRQPVSVIKVDKISFGSEKESSEEKIGRKVELKENKTVRKSTKEKSVKIAAKKPVEKPVKKSVRKLKGSK